MTKQGKPFGLPPYVIAKIRAIFAENSNITEVLIYGSRALGNYRAGSDIDLSIVGEQVTLTDLLQIANALDDLLMPWKIDLSLKHLIDNPALLQHIKDKGQIFYSQTN